MTSYTVFDKSLSNIQFNFNVGIGTDIALTKLHVQGNEFVSGNLGVGTAAPIAPLHVVGATYAQGNVGVGTSVPEYPLHVSVANNTNAAFIKQNATQGNALRVETLLSGGASLLVDRMGNVGIGTATPNAALRVQGNALFSGNVLPTSCNLQDLGSTDFRWRDLYLSGTTIDLGGMKLQKSDTTGGLQVLSSTNQPVDTSTRNLLASGDIIAQGTITASNLNIIGDSVILNTMTSNSEQMVITNVGTGPALKVTQSGANTVAEFYDAEGTTPALFIANGGNLGIGTTNPTRSLHVQNKYMFVGTNNAYQTTTRLAGYSNMVEPAVDGWINGVNITALHRRTKQSYATAENTVNTWTTRTTNTNSWYSICWAPELGIFCAVAGTSGLGNRVMTSPDGINWTTQTSAANNDWSSICWAPEIRLFCAVGSSGVGNRVMTSPNGITWTLQTSAADNGWVSVCWAPELRLFCAVAYSGTNRVMTSSDGIIWTSYTVPANLWNDVCWAPELRLFCAVSGFSSPNDVMTSPDGITWTIRTSVENTRWRSICWSPEIGLFCAIGYSGTLNANVMTSPDGITWTARIVPTNNQWMDVCWAAELGLFCAVAGATSGTGNRIITSPDGITWTIRTSPADLYWISICWAAELGRFCAVAISGGSTNRVMTSAIGLPAPKSTLLVSPAHMTIDQVNGNVGIGSTNPVALLHVSKTDTGDIFRVDDQTAETTPFIINDIGNVGIGLTNPLAKLHTNSEVLLGDNIFTAANNTQLNTAFNGISSPIYGMKWATEPGVGSPSGFISAFGHLRFLTTQAVCMSIMNTGNVGIGTTNPTQRLHIEGNAITTGTVSSGTGFMFRNAIINGCMRFNQRSTGTGTAFPAGATLGWPADRWHVYRNAFATGGTMTYGATLTSSDLPYSQAGLVNFVRVQRLAGNAAGDALYLSQNIESRECIRHAGKQVTLSFYYRTGANITSTFTANIYSGSGTDQSIASGFSGQIAIGSSIFPINSTWSRASLTCTVGATATQLGILFNYTPTATAAGANDWYDITGVQLEQGNVATPFECRPYATEEYLCQRYCIKIGGYDVYEFIGSGVFNTTTNFRLLVPLPVTMRKPSTSTITVSTPLSNWVINSAASYVPTAFSKDRHGANNITLNLTVSGATAGQAGVLLENSATGAGFIIINNEL